VGAPGDDDGHSSGGYGAVWLLNVFGDCCTAVMLEDFGARWMENHVEVSWKLSGADGSLSFEALRKEGEIEDYRSIHSPDITLEGSRYVLRDRRVESGKTYHYRIVVLENGEAATSFEAMTNIPSARLTLYQNHPNPFNPSTTISYHLPEACAVTLEVYDPSGKMIARLLDGVVKPGGMHRARWNGTDDRGRNVASGVYLYRLVAGKETVSRKSLLLR
jgi:hypothetical protein